MRNRSFRRQQMLKKKAWAKSILKQNAYIKISDRLVGLKACSPSMCSCTLCGNPRKYYKYDTLKEEIFKEIWRAELEGL